MIFLLSWRGERGRAVWVGGTPTKMFGNCSQHLPKEKERDMKSSWGRVNFVLALMTLTLNLWVSLQCYRVNLVKRFVDHCLKSSTKLISSPTLQGMFLNSSIVIVAFSVQCNLEKLCFSSSPKRTFSFYLRLACCKQQNLLKVASR